MLPILHKNYDFFCYGSRVKGDYTKSSDLDILVESETKIPKSIINDIELEFNKIKIPYKVNVSDFSKLDSYFLDLIQGDLVKF